MGDTLHLELAGSGERRRLERGTLSIGRDAANDWVLTETGSSPTVSRHHCRIEARDGGFLVADLASTNGTWLNERQLPPHSPERLGDGDRLRVGRFTFAARVEAAAGIGGFGFDLDLPPLPSDPLQVAARAEPPPRAAAPAPGGLDLFSESFASFLPSGERQPAAPSVPRDEGRTRGDHTPAPFTAFQAPVRDPLGGAPVLEAPAPVRETDDFFPPPPAKPEAPKAVPSGAARPGPDLLAAFLEGAGVGPDLLGGEDPAAAMRELGGRFAAMADGLRVLLEARSSLKAEAGLDKTQIGAVGNNPLKASIDRVEAAAALIRARRPGYLPPAEAIEASVRDLVAHELAFMEGVRAALDALLADFDPSALEERLTGEGRVALLLAGGRRAKLWELFVERYAALADQARRRFLGDLDQAFREAYRAKLGQIGSGGRR